VSGVYVAPTEPKDLRDVADQVSQHPERFGVDVLINGEHVTIGIQRKTLQDLVASLDDGRLAEQSVLWGGLENVIVLVEGGVRFRADYLVLNTWGQQISKKQFRRILQTIRSAGVHVEYSNSLDDTIEWVELLAEWCDKETHSTLTPVKQQQRGNWGEQKRAHYQAQVLMGFPGIGAGLAARIVEVCEGLPFTVNIERLAEVPGLGPKKLKKIQELFD